MANQNIKQRSYLVEHRRNFLRETPSSRGSIEPGHIIMFNYRGENVHTPRPLVLVLNPKWENKLHGLNIEYIPERVVQKLHAIVSDTIGAQIKQLMKLRLPLLQPKIERPYDFYHRALKKELVKPEETYRTYNVTGMSSIRIIDYKFKDMA